MKGRQSAGYVDTFCYLSLPLCFPNGLLADHGVLPLPLIPSTFACRTSPLESPAPRLLCPDRPRSCRILPLCQQRSYGRLALPRGPAKEPSAESGRSEKSECLREAMSALSMWLIRIPPDDGADGQDAGKSGGGSGGQKNPGGIPAWSTFMPGGAPVIGGPARPLPQPGSVAAPAAAPPFPLSNLSGGAVPPPPPPPQVSSFGLTCQNDANV